MIGLHLFLLYIYQQSTLSQLCRINVKQVEVTIKTLKRKKRDKNNKTFTNNATNNNNYVHDTVLRTL